MNTVLLAGQNPAQCAAWRDELLATGAWDVLGPVNNFTAARVLMHRHDPDLVIAELRLPDGNVLDMIRVLRVGTAYLKSQILVIGQGQGDPLLLDALQEGADSFYDVNDAATSTLAAHAAETLKGGADIAPWIARHLLDHFGMQHAANNHSAIDEMISPLALTAPERDLLLQLAVGRRLADVARFEKVGPRVLAARVRTIYRKMQWDRRAGDLTLQVA